MEFATILGKILNEQQMNSTDASRKCGMTPQQFGQYLNGKNQPSYKKAHEMIESLNWKLIPTPNV